MENLVSIMLTKEKTANHFEQFHYFCSLLHS